MTLPTIEPTSAEAHAAVEALMVKWLWDDDNTVDDYLRTIRAFIEQADKMDVVLFAAQQALFSATIDRDQLRADIAIFKTTRDEALSNCIKAAVDRDQYKAAAMELAEEVIRTVSWLKCSGQPLDYAKARSIEDGPALANYRNLTGGKS